MSSGQDLGAKNTQENCSDGEYEYYSEEAPEEAQKNPTPISQERKENETNAKAADDDSGSYYEYDEPELCVQNVQEKTVEEKKETQNSSETIGENQHNQNTNNQSESESYEEEEEINESTPKEDGESNEKNVEADKEASSGSYEEETNEKNVETIKEASSESYEEETNENNTEPKKEASSRSYEEENNEKALETDKEASSGSYEEEINEKNTETVKETVKEASSGGYEEESNEKATEADKEASSESEETNEKDADTDKETDNASSSGSEKEETSRKNTETDCDDKQDAEVKPSSNNEKDSDEGARDTEPSDEAKLEVGEGLNVIERALPEDSEEPKIETNDEGHEEIRFDEDGNKEILITTFDTPRAESETEIPEEPEVPKLTITMYQSGHTEEEMQAVLDKYIAKKTLPPANMKEDMIIYTRKQSSVAMMNEDYSKAEQYESAIAEFTRSLNTGIKNDDSDQQTFELKERLSYAQEQQKEVERAWVEQMELFEEQKRQSRQSLEERHQCELRDFQEKWERPETLLPFQKPSVALLQLRKQQKSFAVTRNFAQARQLKLTGDRMMKEESYNARRKAAESMQMEYNTLIERQQKELASWQENWDRKKTVLEQQRSHDFTVNNNVRKQLTTRITAPKKQKRAHVPVVTQSRGSTSRSLVNTGLYSARTRSAIADYRASALEPIRLDLKAADVKAIMRPKMKSARRMLETLG